MIWSIELGTEMVSLRTQNIMLVSLGCFCGPCSGMIPRIPSRIPCGDDEQPPETMVLYGISTFFRDHRIGVFNIGGMGFQPFLYSKRNLGTSWNQGSCRSKTLAEGLRPCHLTGCGRGTRQFGGKPSTCRVQLLRSVNPISIDNEGNFLCP